MDRNVDDIELSDVSVFEEGKLPMKYPGVPQKDQDRNRYCHKSARSGTVPEPSNSQLKMYAVKFTWAFDLISSSCPLS